VGGDVRFDDPGLPGDVGATDPGVDGGPPWSCWSCTTDGDCHGGAKCLPVGPAMHCALECVDDGDCPRSYICYASSTASKSCLPVSYNCVACATDTPCDAGKVCDFTSGICKDGRSVCEHCIYDFDCAEGLRCYKKSGEAVGACVNECSDATPCPATSDATCGTTANGVRLCLPNDPDTCGGCGGATPFPSPDGTVCYGCLNNTHCTTMGQSCDVAGDHTCKLIDGPCGSLKLCADGTCHECCVDADCPVETGPCTDNTCQGECDSCNGQCSGTAFPVMKVINNVPQCVQCGVTADCIAIDPTCTCTGDPTWMCVGTDGNACGGDPCIGSSCTTDADCPPSSSGAALACSGVVGGYCYDPSGRCDGVTTCCGAGQGCFDILSSLAGGMGGGLPGGDIGAYCSCDDSHPCLGNLPCTSTDIVCSFPAISDRLCPGGVKLATLPDKLCVDLAALLGGLLPGGSLP